MTMKLELSDEKLSENWWECSRATVAAPTRSRRTCAGSSIRARGRAREAQLELTFFVRAWQANHPGVRAVLSG